MSIDDVISTLRDLDDYSLRREVFEIGGDGPDPGTAYDYQTAGIRKIEAGESASPPVSGILHYPTGAGKTRVGMELIARTLHRDPEHRFVWATDRKTLIRQSMTRMAELARLFPRGTTFRWAAGADEVKSGEHDANVLFLTRRNLTDVLRQASDGRTVHLWKDSLASGNSITLIYDECHQLGAEQLQQGWRRFHETIVTPSKARWRTIGLSATPVPTSQESHALLRRYVFPQRPKDAPQTNHDWPFHFFHRVKNDALIASGVLCQINLVLDKSGEFDYPEALLRSVVGDARLRPIGAGASKFDVQDYAAKFNRRILSDPRMLAHLADRLGRNFEMLGKTIVFVPTIEAANRFVALLHDRFPALRGRVAAVHSKMNELEVPGQEGETVHRVLDRFRNLRDQPSILVNVEMLTEGFDDPKIRTVVLARLTTSTNRFWQMIGRGTRGPKAGGTKNCYVIDPVKLVRLYEYFKGYQPSFAGQDVEFEDLEAEEPGAGGISPVVPAVDLPPDPRECEYKLSPELERVHAQVVAALRDFLAGGSLTEVQAVQVAATTNVSFAQGGATLVPSTEPFSPLTASAILLGELSSLESRAGRDLSWFRRRLPEALDETLLRYKLRTLRAIEELKLWTESEFAAAEMSGTLSQLLQREAGAAPRAPDSRTAVTVPAVTFAAAEAAVLDAALYLAGIDGVVHPNELEVAVQSLMRMFGRLPNQEVRSAVSGRHVSGPPSLSALRELPPVLRQLLILQLAELAASDGMVSEPERRFLQELSDALGIASAFVESVLGVAGGAEADTAPAPAGVCPSCAFALSPNAAFCSSCGIRVGAIPTQ